MTTTYRHITIRSKDRTFGTASNFSLLLERNVEVYGLMVHSASIPVTIYTIRDGVNDTLNWSETSGTTITGSITLTEGNYSANDLALFLQTELRTSLGSDYNDLTVVVNNDLGKFLFSLGSGKAFDRELTLLSSSSAASIVGLTSDLVIDSPSSTLSSAYTPATFKLNPFDYFFIHSSILAGSLQPQTLLTTLSGDYQLDVIAKIPITVDPGSMLNYVNNETRDQIWRCPKTVLSRIDIRLTNEDNVVVDLNGQEWTCTITLLITIPDAFDYQGMSGRFEIEGPWKQTVNPGSGFNPAIITPQIGNNRAEEDEQERDGGKQRVQDILRRVHNRRLPRDAPPLAIPDYATRIRSPHPIDRITRRAQAEREQLRNLSTMSTFNGAFGHYEYLRRQQVIKDLQNAANVTPPSTPIRQRGRSSSSITPGRTPGVNTPARVPGAVNSSAGRRRNSLSPPRGRSRSRDRSGTLTRDDLEVSFGPSRRQRGSSNSADTIPDRSSRSGTVQRVGYSVANEAMRQAAAHTYNRIKADSFMQWASLFRDLKK